jgi:uncharacterized membrane protein
MTRRTRRRPAHKRKKRKASRTRPQAARVQRFPSKPGVAAQPVLPGFLRWCTRFGLVVVLVLAVAYAASFCAISHAKYRHYDYSDFDLAIFSNAMWNTVHGDFMFTEIRAGCYFKDHVPAILVLLVPLYKLAPSPLTLLYAQSIMLAAGAVPLFLLARRETNGFWGILFAVMYLLYPALGFINLFEFHALSFAPALLLFAFYFFRAKRYVPFLVFALLAMLCREEVALTVMMIGLYALIARRRWHWIAAPAAAGLIWFVICFHVIIPHFNEGKNIFGRLYGEMGETPGEVIKTALTKPAKTIGIALKHEKREPPQPSADKPGYLNKVAAPVSYLAVANPEALLIAAPQFALNLLVDTNVHAPPPTIYFQYTATLIPVLFFSSVLGLARLLRIRVLTQFWYIPAAVVMLVSGATWIFWSPQVAPGAGPPRNMAGTQARDRTDAHLHDELLAQMPADAPAVATFRFLPALSGRRVLASFHYAYMGREKVAAERIYRLPDEVTHALLDLRPHAMWALSFAAPNDADNFLRMLDEGDWGIAARRGQLVLLRKNAPELPKLFRRVEEPTVANRFPAEPIYGDTVKLLGVEATEEPLDGDVQVRVRSAWELMRPLPIRLLVRYALFDEAGQPVTVVNAGTETDVAEVAALGQLALPPAAWHAGDRFEVEHALIIPATVPAGTYTIGVLCSPPGKVSWRLLIPRDRVVAENYCAVMRITLGEESAP